MKGIQRAEYVYLLHSCRNAELALQRTGQSPVPAIGSCISATVNFSEIIRNNYGSLLKGRLQPRTFRIAGAVRRFMQAAGNLRSTHSISKKELHTRIDDVIVTAAGCYYVSHQKYEEHTTAVPLIADDDKLQQQIIEQLPKGSLVIGKDVAETNLPSKERAKAVIVRFVPRADRLKSIKE